MLLLLLQSGKMQGYSIGSMTLPKSSGRLTELCLELTSNTVAGSPVFGSLANIRFTRVIPVPHQGQNDSADGSVTGAAAGAAAAGVLSIDTLEALRAKCNWVSSSSGAGDSDTVMESMFSPYDTEDIDSCVECQPQL
jgi:hypothetical protein